MTLNLQRRPVVGIPCDVKLLGVHPFHAVGEKYIAAVEGGAGTKPILLPVPRLNEGHFDLDAELDEIFALCDGIFLTGSHSNVHPKNYGGTAPREGVLLDEQRDALTLGLIRASVERGVPILGICRGFQEMNVAFGGSLYPEIRELPGRMNHRMPRLENGEIHPDPAVVFADRHEVRLTPGGVFARLFGCDTIRVNSLHGQGLLELGRRVIAEGVAEDSTIEAIRIDSAPSFALGVQWHAEYDPQRNPINRALFQAFGAALAARR